jgi:FKBP-type peptidyl-prolyl cis-trans isomerase FkpA
LDLTFMTTSLRVVALTLSLLATSLTFAQDALSAASAKEAGAVVTASGLVYRSLKDGAGTSPTASDKVKVHYRGTFADGKEFDSSYKRGEPIEFPLNGVIPCWTEGVQRMKVGGKAKLTCPAAIAYGSRGAGGVIRTRPCCLKSSCWVSTANKPRCPAPHHSGFRVRCRQY